jgi:hypothetical protein
MKCYVINLGEYGYIKDVPKVILRRPWSCVIKSTKDIDEAKHYKTDKLASSWVSKSLITLQDDLNKYTTKGEEWSLEKRNQLYHTSYNPFTRVIGETTSVISILSNAKVIEVDVAVPSFNNKFKFRYDVHRERQGTAGKGLTQLCIRTDGRYSCKCCGVKLKKIPFYDFYVEKTAKICIPCLYIRQEGIKNAFESMDEEFRTELQNELIIRSL